MSAGAWWSMSAADAQAPVGLLLAGGRGSRFDPSGHRDKLLALLDGEPVSVHAARTLRAACPQSFAVLPSGKPELRGLIEQTGCEVLVTDATRLGMGHSIAFGAARILERLGSRPLVLALGDMPRVSIDTFHALIARLGGNPLAIVAPTFDGQRGHPVVFGAAHLEALAHLQGDRGAFALLQTNPPQLVPVADPGVLQDIDTPGDLAADAAHDSMDRRRDTPDSHAR